jgi:hypothetical protein
MSMRPARSLSNRSKMSFKFYSSSSVNPPETICWLSCVGLASCTGGGGKSARRGCFLCMFRDEEAPLFPLDAWDSPAAKRAPAGSSYESL